MCDPYSSRRRRGSVEKTCTNCGKVLPRDDARFCNNCGQVIPYSRPLKHSLSGEPPAWMKQLEDSLSHATPSGKLKIHVSDTSTSSARNHTQSSMISEAVEMKAAPEDPKPPHPQETSLHGDISVIRRRPMTFLCKRVLALLRTYRPGLYMCQILLEISNILSQHLIIQ